MCKGGKKALKEINRKREGEKKREKPGRRALARIRRLNTLD